MGLELEAVLTFVKSRYQSIEKDIIIIIRMKKGRKEERKKERKEYKWRETHERGRARVSE